MSDQFMARIALSLAFLTFSQTAFCDIQFVVPNNYDIVLSDAEKIELTEIQSNLVLNVSELLLQSIDDSTGTALLIDQRADQHDQHPLMAIIDYPLVTVNEHRTFQPRVVCKGTFDPATWEYCFESSNTYLNIPDHGQIDVDHESISVESAQIMMAIVDVAGLESPKGARIAAHGIHNIQYIDRDGFYLLLGATPRNEHFSLKLQPISKDGVDTYAISEWSCQ